MLLYENIYVICVCVSVEMRNNISFVDWLSKQLLVIHNSNKTINFGYICEYFKNSFCDLNRRFLVIAKIKSFV
jgi:hypothetical protein